MKYISLADVVKIYVGDFCFEKLVPVRIKNIVACGSPVIGTYIEIVILPFISKLEKMFV